MNRIINLSPSTKVLSGYVSGDDVLAKCDAVNNAFAVTMPDARSARNVEFCIKKTDSSSNAVTFDYLPGQEVESISLTQQYDVVCLSSDGEAYQVKSKILGDLTITSLTVTDATISGDLTLSGLTQNSVLFVGADGLISESNQGITWDNTNKILALYRDSSSATPGIKIEEDGTGDASQTFLLTGGQSYTIGIDNSETGDPLKISPGASLSNTDYFVMDSGGRLSQGTLPEATYKYLTYYSPVNINATHDCFKIRWWPFSTTLPSNGSGIDVDGRMYVRGVGIYQSNYGLNFSMKTYITSGNSCTGVLKGIQGLALHDSPGDITSLFSLDCTFGNYSGCSSGVTTNAYGLYLRPYARTGTVTNLSAIHILDTLKDLGGTATNEKCIFSGMSAPCSFAGDIRIDADDKYFTVGAAQDGRISYDGSDMIIDPDNVGSGILKIGTTADDTIDAGAYKVGGTAAVADNTYNFYNDGTSGNVTSITTKSGIITAITTAP